MINVKRQKKKQFINQSKIEMNLYLKNSNKKDLVIAGMNIS